MFDFDKHIDRHGTNSLKWNKYKDQDIIPLWVADMDFMAPPGVLEALHQRADHGIFGYCRPTPRLIELVIRRMKERYQWDIHPDWLLFLPGVVPTLNFGIRAWCNAGRKVITPRPIYYPFLYAPEYNDRSISYVPMQLNDDRWTLDFAELERQAADADVFLLCNPHNPGSSVYTRTELEKIADIATRYNLTVISDEIHCDLILDPQARHIPFASISPDAAERSAVLMAPSKTFNIAGLCSSFAIIPNAKLRLKFQQATRGLLADNNLLGLTAAEAAYETGDAWLGELLDYLRGNLALIQSTLKEFPMIHLAEHQATYLAWIDVSALKLDDPIAAFEAGGIGLSPGAQFGDKQFVRLNFGCTRATLQQALDRMASVIRSALVAK